MKTLKASIPNMGSNHCVMVVKNTIGKLEGAAIRNIEVGKAEIEFDENIIASGDIVKAIESAGYRVSVQ